MDFRNAVYSSADGQQIDMEIDHPVFGWAPFTARPDDPEPLGRDLYAAALLGYVADYVEPEIELETPAEISDRQFFHVLALDGLISEAEALAAVKTGDAPAAFDVFIASLPEAERFGARMLLEGATMFRRDHPLTNAFGSMYGLSSEEIDDLWRRASDL
jgi:hypothetical protein